MILSARERCSSPVVWSILIISACISVCYSYHYFPFTADDALISYRYSYRLLHDHGLTWTNGVPVEGYSDLLWVLLVAAGGLIEPNLIIVGRILGLAANVLLLWSVVWVSSSYRGWVPMMGGVLTLALSGSCALWGIGGMETALFSALLGWAVALVDVAPVKREERGVIAGIILGLLAITRPDGILFGATIPGALLIRHGATRDAVRSTVSLLAWPVAFLAFQLVFRLTYYGSVLPNTAYVKIAFALNRFVGGGLYVLLGAIGNLIPLAACTWILVLLPNSQRREVLRKTSVSLLPGVVWLAYLWGIGGDFFPGFRLWQPALVCLAFALARLLSVLPALSAKPAVWILGISAAGHLGVQVAMAGTAEWFVRGHPEISQFPIQADASRIAGCISAGRLLSEAFSEQQPLLAVDGAGCLPYGSELPALDMLGLNDAYIAHHRPPDMGNGRLAHELGDGDYVYSRNPDLVQFGAGNSSPNPELRGDEELAAMPGFRGNYCLVYFRSVKGPVGLWVRVENGHIGITRTDEAIRVPGFLFATTPAGAAAIDPSGRLGAVLTPDGVLKAEVYLPAGDWRLMVLANTAEPVRATILPDTVDRSSSTLHVSRSGAREMVRIRGGRGMVYSVSFTREPQPLLPRSTVTRHSSGPEVARRD